MNWIKSIVSAWALRRKIPIGNIVKAARDLEEEGIDLQRLLEIWAAASAMAVAIKATWGKGIGFYIEATGLDRSERPNSDHDS